MANKIIFIAGPSASGKSRYAEHLNNQFHMPVICKDSVKELLYEGTGFSPVSIEAVQKYGACAYDLLFYFAECLMKCGTGLYDDYETFHKNAEKARQFHSGTEKLTVDTSDWSRVDYGVIDRQIALFLKIK